VVILAGGGTRHADAVLTALAMRLDAPVIQTINARGLLHGHALCVPASPGLEACRALAMEADQVLAIGTEFGPTDYDMYVTQAYPDLPGLIRIDISEEQLAKLPAEMKLLGDAEATIAALLPRLAPKSGDGAARAAATRAAARAVLGELDARMPQRLEMVEAIRTALPGALIVGDSTQPVYAGNLYYDHDVPGGWFNAATGYGALGYGTGAAVGAAIAQPDRHVVCLIGDGGLQFSPGELRTAVDEKARVTFLVWNNAAFREIADAMREAGAEVIGCHPSPLRLEPFAAACDLPFTSIPMEPEVLIWALQQPCDGPRLIEVRVTV
jgi:acetolactate synthase-1/2/3 large subunit